ncbi:protein C10 isoform X1 [Aphis craccivora]|uniref:Protein C10 n=1 Tax=Aphis craccivora TaxID=307492 RepID=A0A6G0YIC0_APHCR|nr:protein C10 isoform X1 [Aphis craccivora]
MFYVVSRVMSRKVEEAVCLACITAFSLPSIEEWPPEMMAIAFAEYMEHSVDIILAEILESLTTCENALNLEDAKSKAGNDMLKVMQYVYPIVVSTQMDVIKKYGLPEGREGIIKFTRSVVAFEKDDRVVADLHRQIRSFYLPPVNVSSAVTSHV